MKSIEKDLIQKTGLPFNLIDMVLSEGNKTIIDFKIRLCEIDKNQDMELVEQLGLTARFDVVLKTDSINACILTGLTVGNVYKFYNTLKDAYEKSDGYAQLKEYGTNSGTDFSVVFDVSGLCDVQGKFSDNGSINSGVKFDFHCEKDCFCNSLKNLEYMFKEFAEFQGNKNFNF